MGRGSFQGSADLRENAAEKSNPVQEMRVKLGFPEACGLNKEDRMEWKDGKCRCRWANPGNELYLRYHDEKWGVPVYDDQKLFEMLILESFQAGLSWECVLNKREAFRRVFHQFDLETVCGYGEADMARLMEDKGIIRNRLKIRAAVSNARIFREIQREYGSFSQYLWHWTEGRVIYESGLANSPLSDQVSADLKKRGMKFVGTTIVYAYLQAVGVINSHEEGCFCRHRQAAESRRGGEADVWETGEKEKAGKADL